MPLADQPLRELLAAFSSSDPTPGGGSAAALAAALGASLLMMVAGLPKTRTGADDERPALGDAAAALGGIRAQLTDAIDADAAAYDRVVAAYRLPKATADEKAARKRAIQQALRAATEVPLDVMRLSAAPRPRADGRRHGHRAAASDVGVALALLQRRAARRARSTSTSTSAACPTRPTSTRVTRRERARSRRARRATRWTKRDSATSAVTRRSRACRSTARRRGP